MKVVVTGGSGRLGRFVVKLLKSKYDVTVFDVKPSDVEGVGYRNVDVTDLASLTQAFQGVDAVIHLAAVPNPRTSTPATTSLDARAESRTRTTCIVPRAARSDHPVARRQMKSPEARSARC